jgi:hypothetical protein
MTGKHINKTMIPNHKLKSDIAQIKDAFNGNEQLDMIVKLTDVIKKNADEKYHYKNITNHIQYTNKLKDFKAQHERNEKMILSYIMTTVYFEFSGF